VASTTDTLPDKEAATPEPAPRRASQAKAGREADREEAMHTQEIATVLRRLRAAEEPMVLFVGPSGPHLVPADAELVGTYNDRVTEEELRQDLAAVGEDEGAGSL
jgi:hypothetical protein